MYQFFSTIERVMKQNNTQTICRFVKLLAKDILINKQVIPNEGRFAFYFLFNWLWNDYVYLSIEACIFIVVQSLTLLNWIKFNIATFYNTSYTFLIHTCNTNTITNLNMDGLRLASHNSSSGKSYIARATL